MTDRIKVAQVVTRFIAGAGGVALRGALALEKDRYAVTILSAPGGTLLDEAERHGFDVVRLRHLRPELNPRADYQAFLELRHEFRKGAFDVVHTHSSKAGALGRAAAARVGVPGIVHTFHGFPFHEFQSRVRRAAYITIERRLGRITHRFLAVGSAVAAEAVRRRIASPERIRVIAPAIGTDVTRLTPAAREHARRALGLPLMAPVIGCVGRLDYQKAPEHLVAAMVSLRRSDVHAVWIGGGPLQDRVQRLAARHGMGDRFRLLGERADVGTLLPAFDVFAMASRYEGLPCALIEAMECGVPVIATAVNAVPEVVIAGRTGLLVPPAQPALLGQALAYLLDHPREGERLAAAARAQLGDRFRSATLGRDLTETYESLLVGRGLGAPLALASDEATTPSPVSVGQLGS